MAVNSETGAQLFARLGEKPSLEGLDPRLIPPGLHPQPGDVVEIYGNSGSGKTEVLLNLAASCVLPGAWRGIPLGGLGVGVVFIDTDHQFSMLRLFDILEKRVLEASAVFRASDKNSETAAGRTDGSVEESREHSARNRCPEAEGSAELDVGHCEEEREAKRPQPPSEDEVEGFLKACLGRLYVVRVATSAQLVVTLYSLESLLAGGSVSALLLDSVSAFHWTDRMKGEGAHQHAANQRLAFAALARLLRDYHLAAFATKAALVSKHGHDYAEEEYPHLVSASGVVGPSASFSTEHHEFMTRDWTKLVTHRIILERRDSINPDSPSSSLFVSFLKHKASGRVAFCQFSVGNHGIVHQD